MSSARQMQKGWYLCNGPRLGSHLAARAIISLTLMHPNSLVRAILGHDDHMGTDSQRRVSLSKICRLG